MHNRQLGSYHFSIKVVPRQNVVRARKSQCLTVKNALESLD